MDSIPRAFGGISRLYGEGQWRELRGSHVMIVGIGGVGSWAAESLARSGVGKITLIDMDDVCESNINRQIHATNETVGKPKVEAMAERIRSIDSQIEVVTHLQFLTATTIESLMAARPDAVFDAIDSLRHKIALLKYCRRRKIPLIISGGAGGLKDPTLIKVDDLARSRNDRLLQKMRKELRMKHGYTRDTKKKFGVACVYSTELAQEPVFPEEVCETDEPQSRKLDCETGYGTAGFVTSAFGLAASHWIVEKLMVPKK